MKEITDEIDEAIRRHAAGEGYRAIAAAVGRSRHWVRQKLIQRALRVGPPAVVEIEPRTSAEFVERIEASWRRSVGAIIETGRLLSLAKDALPHGEFLAMVESALPFGASTAQRLMKIAADSRISNAAHVQHLPASWGTLYELTKLDDSAFEARLADGTIRADMERKDLFAVVRQERRDAHAARTFAGGTVDDLRNLAASGFRGGVILADPPWKFITRSEHGEGRSANQHYRTDAFDLIKALPVAGLAAPDAVLFMWIVDWFPTAAIEELIEAWGFVHITTAFTWAKQNESGEGWHMGQGYWTRANPETCWLATRGSPKRLYADVRQLIVHPVMEHSRKPDEVHDRIERLVSGPYLELYARRERKGWQTWGDELAFRLPQTETRRQIGDEFPCVVPHHLPRDIAQDEVAAPSHVPTVRPRPLNTEDDPLLDIPNFLRRVPREAAK